MAKLEQGTINLLIREQVGLILGANKKFDEAKLLASTITPDTPEEIAVGQAVSALLLTSAGKKMLKDSDRIKALIK